MPANRGDLGPFYRDVIAVDPLEPWTAASAAYRLHLLARTLPFPVGGLDPAHPLHTLRRLADAPLPRTYRGIP